MGKLSYGRRLVRELWQLAMERKAYWIIPLMLVLGLIALLIATSQASAPFIYTLF